MDQLFGGGQSHSVAAFPLRAVYMQRERQEGQEPVEVLVSVPKKHLHHAVDRNRVKRQVREAYRLQKELLTARVPQEQTLDIAFIWLCDRLRPSVEIRRKMSIVLERIGRGL
jgi:ribonuclease P protein component